MFLAFQLLFFLGLFCKLVSALVSSGLEIRGKIISDLSRPTPVHLTSSLRNDAAEYSASIRPTLRQNLSANSKRSKFTRQNAAVLPDTYPVESLDLMRKVYGPRRRWWGDLSAQQTRAFYHDLLPIELQSDNTLTLEQRARRACMARHAARLYARERCSLPARITATLYDGFRHLKDYGTWNSAGLTWDELYKKYEVQIRREHPTESESFVREAVIRRILEKSCSTNEFFDKLTGKSNPYRPQSVAASDLHRRWKRKLLTTGKRVIRQPLLLMSPKVVSVRHD